jgi:methylated-DNA-[protein]-cysteine S-methyltransferase
MRNYSKTGGRPGQPGYRVSSMFRNKVLDVVSKIPRGKTMTYKQVAVRSGNPKAFRAVGNILSQNYDPKIPCHRVIRSDGKIGKYNRGKNNKIAILRMEKAID